MKQHKRMITVLMALCLTMSSMYAQKKYAVLITGDQTPPEEMPGEDKWNNGNDMDPVYGYDEFWNDTYLLWELLYKPEIAGGKGYANENIYVLYGDEDNNGNDFTFDDQDDRYKSWPNYGINNITDHPATKANIHGVFTSLKNIITPDDYLFVWMMGNGGRDFAPTKHYFYDADNQKVYSDDLAGWIEDINAFKTTVVLYFSNACFVADEFDKERTIVITHAESCGYTDRADDKARKPDGNLTFFEENEVINNITYHHGETNYHLYSSLAGETPNYLNIYYNTPLFAADENSDFHISMAEAEKWNDTYNSSFHETSSIDDVSGIAGYTGMKIPTLLHGDIEQDMLVRGRMATTLPTHLKTGYTMTFKGKVESGFENDLTTEAGSVLKFYNYTLLDNKYSISDNRGFIIDGSLYDVQNVTIKDLGIPGQTNGFVMNNSPAYPGVDFDNVSFIRTGFVSHRQELNILNSSYEDCGVAYSYNGDVNIDNTDYTNTWLFLEDQSVSGNHTAVVTGCTCTNNEGSMMTGIDIYDYDNFRIDNNVISGFYNGIQMHNSGAGRQGAQSIYGNTIYNNSESGIIIYSSFADIISNTVQYNDLGVQFFNNSYIELSGDPDVLTDTQIISDNSSYEVYTSHYSFPTIFWHNEIIDEDNLGNPVDPLVYYNASEPILNPLDVMNNCWGDNFTPSEDLYPAPDYNYLPVWCPGNNKSSFLADSLEQVYFDALDDFEAENYTDAQSTLKQLIINFPGSKYAMAAMKKLFVVEKFAGEDYNGLKQFYITHDSVLGDTNLVKVGGFLANKCNLKLENWPSAINHYEDIIQNPDSFEDSIFAIIDLGYVYILLENSGYKNAYSGVLTEHKPETKQKHFEKRDYLLSLLPEDQYSHEMKNGIKRLKAGELLQNVPNPFTLSTQIWFHLDIDAHVSLCVFDYTGKMIQSSDLGYMQKGKRFVDLNCERLSPGFYFYSLEINGQLSDAKKMTKMR